VTVTAVALVAVTVSIDEAPALMDVGLALMATLGGGTIIVPEFAPQPAMDNKRGQKVKNKTTEITRRTNIEPLELFTVFSCRTSHVWPCDPRGTVDLWTP
jgi:hypothetical protein